MYYILCFVLIVLLIIYECCTILFHEIKNLILVHFVSLFGIVTKKERVVDLFYHTMIALKL